MRTIFPGSPVGGIWKSNAALFIFSLAAGFLVGSGCVVGTNPESGVPTDFHFILTEAQDNPIGGGRFVVESNGEVVFDDWGAEGARHVIYRDVWSPEEVGSVYTLLMNNSIRSLKEWDSDIAQDDFVAADHTVVIESQMRGQSYKVYAVIDPSIELSNSVTNIIDWYHGRTGIVRARAAREVGGL